MNPNRAKDSGKTLKNAVSLPPSFASLKPMTRKMYDPYEKSLNTFHLKPNKFTNDRVVFGAGTRVPLKKFLDTKMCSNQIIRSSNSKLPKGGNREDLIKKQRSKADFSGKRNAANESRYCAYSDMIKFGKDFRMKKTHLDKDEYLPTKQKSRKKMDGNAAPKTKTSQKDHKEKPKTTNARRSYAIEENVQKSDNVKVFAEVDARTFFTGTVGNKKQLLDFEDLLEATIYLKNLNEAKSIVALEIELDINSVSEIPSAPCSSKASLYNVKDDSSEETMTLNSSKFRQEAYAHTFQQTVFCPDKLEGAKIVEIVDEMEEVGPEFEKTPVDEPPLAEVDGDIAANEEFPLEDVKFVQNVLNNIIDRSFLSSEDISLSPPASEDETSKEKMNVVEKIADKAKEEFSAVDNIQNFGKLCNVVSKRSCNLSKHTFLIVDTESAEENKSEIISYDKQVDVVIAKRTSSDLKRPRIETTKKEGVAAKQNCQEMDCQTNIFGIRKLYMGNREVKANAMIGKANNASQVDVMVNDKKNIHAEGELPKKAFVPSVLVSDVPLDICQPDLKKEEHEIVSAPRGDEKRLNEKLEGVQKLKDDVGNIENKNVIEVFTNRLKFHERPETIDNILKKGSSNKRLLTTPSSTQLIGDKYVDSDGYAGDAEIPNKKLKEKVTANSPKEGGIKEEGKLKTPKNKATLEKVSLEDLVQKANYYSNSIMKIFESNLAAEDVVSKNAPIKDEKLIPPEKAALGKKIASDGNATCESIENIFKQISTISQLLKNYDESSPLEPVAVENKEKSIDTFFDALDNIYELTFKSSTKIATGVLKNSAIGTSERSSSGNNSRKRVTEDKPIDVMLEKSQSLYQESLYTPTSSAHVLRAEDDTDDDETLDAKKCESDSKVVRVKATHDKIADRNAENFMANVVTKNLASVTASPKSRRLGKFSIAASAQVQARNVFGNSSIVNLPTKETKVESIEFEGRRCNLTPIPVSSGGASEANSKTVSTASSCVTDNAVADSVNAKNYATYTYKYEEEDVPARNAPSTMNTVVKVETSETETADEDLTVTENFFNVATSTDNSVSVDVDRIKKKKENVPVRMESEATVEQNLKPLRQVTRRHSVVKNISTRVLGATEPKSPLDAKKKAMPSLEKKRNVHEADLLAKPNQKKLKNESDKKTPCPKSKSTPNRPRGGNPPKSGRIFSVTDTTPQPSPKKAKPKRTDKRTPSASSSKKHDANSLFFFDENDLGKSMNISEANLVADQLALGEPPAPNSFGSCSAASSTTSKDSMSVSAMKGWQAQKRFLQLEYTRDASPSGSATFPGILPLSPPKVLERGPVHARRESRRTAWPKLGGTSQTFLRYCGDEKMKYRIKQMSFEDKFKMKRPILLKTSVRKRDAWKGQVNVRTKMKAYDEMRRKKAMGRSSRDTSTSPCSSRLQSLQQQLPSLEMNARRKKIFSKENAKSVPAKGAKKNKSFASKKSNFPRIRQTKTRMGVRRSGMASGTVSKRSSSATIRGQRFNDAIDNIFYNSELAARKIDEGASRKSSKNANFEKKTTPNSFPSGAKLAQKAQKTLPALKLGGLASKKIPADSSTATPKSGVVVEAKGKETVPKPKSKSKGRPRSGSPGPALAAKRSSLRRKSPVEERLKGSKIVIDKAFPEVPSHADTERGSSFHFSPYLKQVNQPVPAKRALVPRK